MEIRQFLIKTSRFLLIMAAFFCITIAFVGATHKFLPHDMYYSSEFETAFKNGDAEMLAIGNSKLLASLDKGILEKELDKNILILGCLGSNMSVTKLILQSYLNKAKVKPKLILMEASWFSFNTDRTMFNDLPGELVMRDPNLWFEMKNYYPEISDKIKRSLVKQILEKVRPKAQIDYSAEFTKKSPISKDYSFEIEKFEQVFPDHIAGVDSLLLNDFQSIIKMCKDNDIELILYTAPEDFDYTSSQIDREEIKSIYKSVSNTLYLDYTLGGELYNKNYEFWLRDSDHINENDLFTKVLAKDIKARRKD